MASRKPRKKPPSLGIKPARKPTDHDSLSSTVLVWDDGGIGVCLIRFTDKLVEFVGKKLPRGVGPADPAYLHVCQEFEVWAVHATYISEEASVLLWRQVGRPEWLGKPRRFPKERTACC